MLPSLASLPHHDEAHTGKYGKHTVQALRRKATGDAVPGFKELLIDYYDAVTNADDTKRGILIAQALSALQTYWEEHAEQLSQKLPHGKDMFGPQISDKQLEEANSMLFTKTTEYAHKSKNLGIRQERQGKKWAECFLRSLQDPQACLEMNDAIPKVEKL